MAELSVGTSGFAGSINDGGANTTAVLEMVALEIVGPEATEVATAPTGRRGAVGLIFCAAFRRIGAKARLADHPEGYELRQRRNRRAWMTTV